MKKKGRKHPQVRLPDGTVVPQWVLSRRLVAAACAMQGISLMALNMQVGDYPGFIYKILDNPRTQASTWSRYAAALDVPLPQLMEVLEEDADGDHPGGAA